MEKVKRSPAKTRERLLKTAVEVFATEGIAGATTREIARRAEVNELTLFRHFQNKEQLLKAVVHYTTALQAEALEHQDEWTQDLRIDLLHYGKVYSDQLEQHEALVRMFIGEAKRHPEEAIRITQEAMMPLRDKLIAYLRNGEARGIVRPDVDLALAIDMFTGMLLAGMLRQHISPILRGYSQTQYVEGCVELFVNGISPVPVNSANSAPLNNHRR
ncbi:MULTISPECIES: TetR/AcrR family transcriptional regulator [Pseudanabaena]|uniref:Transcriptional regulator, TetR family n=2 Tax=Pseudanabaena TaxID=1152 RepID=L8N0A2_9CYAN|nr:MULTISPECIES: TetR/AcrR family transcriptional regulator [Pseudanabaena]ELS32165.1 transcriptional regulator, TetR family [Pseudanabaena biceps PCC 7429]MDG3495601.1 TetR/AcrR family transcriptional regulator [Pseudanabaena catenata USMAC16]